MKDISTKLLYGIFWIALILYICKFVFCTFSTTTGWLTLKDNSFIPEGCYYEKRGNSYKVKIRNKCELTEGKLDILCPNGNEVIIGKAHGKFVDGNVTYLF